MTAQQAKISDWISNSRQVFRQALDVFAAYNRLAHEAGLTGRVVVAEDNSITTNLRPENFVGENAELDPQEFAETFAALGALLIGVDDAMASELYAVSA